MKKNVLKGVIAFGIVALLAIAMLFAYKQLKPQGTEGSKKITVEVIADDEAPKEFNLQTDAQFLRQALEEENLVKGSEGEYGLFITEVNGRAADDSKQEWWCITKSGADVFTSVDETPVADGDRYELTLKVGY